MSVAFRRESDEEHKEPKFEIPLPPGPNQVTPRGLALIAAKVVELEHAVAAAESDEACQGLRRDLRYWHTRQTTATVTAAPDDDTVGFGSRVTFVLNGATRTIALVGADEADPAEDRIVFTAPLAQAMMDALAGERIDFAGRVEAIEIVAVDNGATDD